MRKAAFFDIDGTLINVPGNMHQPSTGVIQALKQFRKEGNEIFLASARGSSPIDPNLITFDGFIGNDGHYIVHHGEVIIDDLFETEEVRHMMQVFEHCHGRFVFSGHVNSWSAYWDDPYVQKHAMMFRHSAKRPDDLIEMFEPEDVHAIACCVLFEMVDDLLACYQKLKDRFTMVKYETGLIRMDVYRKGFEKGSAVKYLSERCGYDKENTYAFGDGINDVEMFRMVGHGIAMGNAVPQLKQIAEEVTLSVEEDGIAEYMNRKLLR